MLPNLINSAWLQEELKLQEHVRWARKLSADRLTSLLWLPGFISTLFAAFVYALLLRWEVEVRRALWAERDAQLMAGGASG